MKELSTNEIETVSGSASIFNVAVEWSYARKKFIDDFNKALSGPPVR
ncbi:MAG: hypothetical protein HRT53_17915 [Colwellia sp.]|nr:hypothetical protein [Colwellia sp.]